MARAESLSTLGYVCNGSAAESLATMGYVCLDFDFIFLKLLALVECYGDYLATTMVDGALGAVLDALDAIGTLEEC